MDNRFKEQTVGMVDKHLTVLRENMVASVEAQRQHTISNLQCEHEQMVNLEQQLQAAADEAIAELNKVLGKNIATIHRTLSNVMAPITDRKLALAAKLSEFEDADHGNREPQPEEQQEVLSLPAPKKKGFFRSRSSKGKVVYG